MSLIAQTSSLAMLGVEVEIQIIQYDDLFMEIQIIQYDDLSFLIIRRKKNPSILCHYVIVYTTQFL